MEKEEFFTLLPKLIKEDEQVKGAIITALSGVVATKDDIKELINSNKDELKLVISEFNKRFEIMDKHFETIQL